MPFKVDVADDAVVEWERRAGGVRRRRVTDYRPSLYVEAPTAAREELEAALAADPKVAGAGVEEWYTSLRDDERTPVLRVDVERPSEVRTLAREVRHHHEPDARAPGTYRLYNVDFAPQFRYCLATGADPVPDEPLSTFSLRLDEKPLADGDVTTLELDGEVVRAPAEPMLRTVRTRVLEADPDVLVFRDAGLLPLLFERAAEEGVADFRLGREPGYRQLAGENTFESYGRVGHSAARYDVPGRVVIDESNSFLWSQTTLEGLLDLVAHSGKPLQETAWGSIGNILTAIQMREALERDVLVPWNKWEPEAFKDVRTLHAADRGGFTFAPQVGLHEGVVEVDFASLYPRIMVEFNVSPDTVLCDCHADREDVPVLGYNVCDEEGFLVDVLRPLLEQRADLKARAAAADDAAAERLDERSNALKWILVSCFGYQGYRNSKFGRIECHEAINAHARDILLAAKERFEANGWEVVHGIVDSIWVKRRPGVASAPVEELTAAVTDEVGIALEFEGEYEWVCFVPMRDSEAGALTKYFGKFGGTGEFKVRGIERRQRSTPAFVGESQTAFLEALDAERTPEAVCDVLRERLRELHAGTVPAADLVIRTRASKSLGEYTQETLTVAALRRAADHDVPKRPGQDVRYVVVDDDARRTRERVRLPFEPVEDYDADFYEDLLVRATESVTSPLGWDRERVRRYLADRANGRLSAYR